MTRRRRLLVAAALAVALCAGYLSATIGHRLDHGSSWWHGADAESRPEGRRTELRFAFNPGRRVTFGASIRNPGRWPVTITGIAVDDGPADQHVFKIARLAVTHADEASAIFDPAAAVAFQSIRVAAGAELPVFVTITIPDVEMAPGSGLFFDDLAVDYEVLGLPRHQRVPMGFRLSVRSANGYVPR
ncbi:hypothetical protein U2F26_23190 [Micromonospora sp. 4G57]|uniref:Copper chaperone PCu(A)C n=1 Tax=Micromonospora sicca TaxID=2202420 RepID=A0ABU5JFY7_9ACTN|nr:MULTISPECIES: hypothetical protein [unclassified Micromonospora]MDZ5445601.1 hypothetical protein [Micromonospora sp. 4G57]MDZ5491466.1 hypothetical protein [Micromonospora sp. 4G53]